MIVYYRMCGIPSTNRSPIFQEDKFKLNQLCLRSFVNAFRDVNPYMVFLNDFCDPRYNEMIDRIVPFDKEIHSSEIGINATCLKQYDIAEKAEDDVILFQECDYFYFPHTGKTLEEAIKELGRVSPYDHPDKYPLEISQIKLAANHHFKKSISTTSTYGTTREQFLKDLPILRKHGYLDHQRFIELGGVWTPIPSLATHMVKDYMAPTIPWKEVYEAYL